MWGFWSRLRLLDALGMGGCGGGAAAGAGAAGAAEDIAVVESVVVLSFELCEALSCARRFVGLDREIFAHGVN
jgi:hypothetical protein